MSLRDDRGNAVYFNQFCQRDCCLAHNCFCGDCARCICTRQPDLEETIPT